MSDDVFLRQGVESDALLSLSLGRYCLCWRDVLHNRRGATFTADAGAMYITKSAGVAYPEGAGAM